jgi:hypothetical protein
LFFADALNYGDWIDVKGFTRIVVPDTFIYKSVIENQNLLTALADTSVKNTLGPSTIWYFANGDWIIASCLNSFCLFFVLLYVTKIATILKIKNNQIKTLLIILSLLPSTIYHSVGALKEIPTMLFLTGFFYHYIKKQNTRWIIYTLMGTFFRSQFILVVSIFLLSNRFQHKSLLVSFYILFIISAAYPLLHLDVLSSESTAIYREEASAVSGGSFGAFVEVIRSSIPVASFFAIIIRIFQSVFEPIITFLSTRSLFEEGSFSIILIAYLSSVIICIKAWIIFPKTILLSIKKSCDIDMNKIKLYTLCVSFIYPVGGFSFIHHRYLYPVMGLLLLAGATADRSNSVSREKNNTIYIEKP